MITVARVMPVVIMVLKVVMAMAVVFVGSRSGSESGNESGSESGSGRSTKSDESSGMVFIVVVVRVYMLS